MKVAFMFLQFALPTLLLAQQRNANFSPPEDPRGSPELTVCSQNLANYGSYSAVATRTGLTLEQYEAKERAIAKRIVRAGCDIIAVQELLGKSELDAKKALQRLAKIIGEVTSRVYEPAIGSSNETIMRNGYLVAKDRAEISNTLSYGRVELPKISEKEKPRFFSRGPLELQVNIKPREGSEAKTATLVNFHLKSQSGAEGDPAALEWETYRMQMAEALRRIVQSRHKGSFTRGENILIVLGDRNSNFDLASSRILEGTLSLDHFLGDDGACRLSKRGVPLCKPNVSAPQVLFSVLRADLQTKVMAGTFNYKGKYSWLDDILLPTESLRLAWAGVDSEGDYDTGIIYGEPDASDHALVYVRFNY